MPHPMHRQDIVHIFFFRQPVLPFEILMKCNVDDGKCNRINYGINLDEWLQRWNEQFTL